MRFHVDCAGPKRSSLLELPNELLQSIASLLPSDQDLVNLSLVCKEAWTRVLASDSAVWRARFNDRYNTPLGRSTRELKLEYQVRAIALRQKIDFKLEKSAQQDVWLEVIQTMIDEALTLPFDMDTSKTYKAIQQVMTDTGFLSHPKRAQPSELFCAVQLNLTPLALDYSTFQPCGRTDYDIAAVYSYREEVSGPFVKHERLDLAVLLHMRSFWQYHLGNCEDTFHSSFAQIAENAKPKMRKGNGIDVPILSTSWLGYYSCIHPLPETLEGFAHRETCADLEDHLEQIEVMTLELKIQRETFWPEKCNQIIPEAEGSDETRVYFEGVQNTLGSRPDAANPLFGFTEPIAPLYGGFKGWSRICFVIYEQIDEDEEDAWASEDHWVHGYEAVILPGGSIMLGRWIDLNETTGRGPFIFWNI